MKLLKFTQKLWVLVIIICMTQTAEAQFNSEIDFEKPFVKCWQIDVPDFDDYKFASDNENELFIFRNDGFIQSFDLDTKKEIWNFNFGGKFNGNSIIVSKQIYFLTSDKNEDFTKIRVANKSNGVVEWESEIPIKNVTNIIVHEEIIILLTGENKIIAFNKVSKKVIWTTYIDKKVILEPQLFEDRIIVTVPQEIIFISLQNGQISAKIQTGIDNISAILVQKKSVYLGNNKGDIFLIDVENTKKNWEFKTGGAISHILNTTEGTLVLSFDNFIYLFAENSSKLIWKIKSPVRNIIAPIVNKNSLIITNYATNSSNIYDLINGKLKNKITIEEKNLFLGKPLVINESLIFPTLQGLYIFRNNDC